MIINKMYEDKVHLYNVILRNQCVIVNIKKLCTII